jgi:hypothetical protein
MCDNYEDKYLKYKAKYLELKQLGGIAKRRVYFINKSRFYGLGYNSTSVFLNKHLVEILPKNIQDLGYVYMEEDSNNVIIPEGFLEKIKDKLGDLTKKISLTSKNIANKIKSPYIKQEGGYTFTIKTPLKLNTSNEVIQVNNIYNELNINLKKEASEPFNGYLVVGYVKGTLKIIRSKLD